MDYKQKYEEALGWMQSLYNGLHGKTKEEAEHFFPELKESEDEKSKKWILEYLYDGLRKSDEQFKDHFKAAIAWLEKQGEQKKEIKYIYPKFRVGDVIERAKPNGYSAPVRIKYIGEGNYSCESDDCKSYLSFPICNENEYVLTGQKPTWSEKDDKFLVDTVDFLYRTKNQYAQTVRIEQCIDWLKSLKDRLK